MPTRSWMPLLMCVAACSGPDARAPVEPAPEPAVQNTTTTLLHSPKAGERVRQPELDGYCDDSERVAAFYYHGGNPAVRVARKDQCTPLYLTECESEARCYPPRDQEPGMWCCALRPDEHPATHAAR